MTRDGVTAVTALPPRLYSRLGAPGDGVGDGVDGVVTAVTAFPCTLYPDIEKSPPAARQMCGYKVGDDAVTAVTAVTRLTRREQPKTVSLTPSVGGHRG